jgi:hypothetical protein
MLSPNRNRGSFANKIKPKEYHYETYWFFVFLEKIILPKFIIFYYVASAIGISIKLRCQFYAIAFSKAFTK